MADMGSDARVVFELDADDKKLVQGLNDATRKIQTETGKWDKAGTDAANNIGNAWKKLLTGGAIAAAAAKIGKMLGDLAVEAINLASDLEEVQNVVDVTFGNDNTVIEKWAKNAGKQFGLTEVQAKRFTSTLGAMLKSAGLTGTEITSMSTDLAGLAADMASFYNLDFDTAFDKIRSGISGQTEPLKALGINLSESNLKAFAEEQGKVYKDLSEAEKIVLRYQYLMQATADAQGDFARTSDGYANSMRLFETNLTQLKTTIGTALLPFVNEAVAGINDLLSALNKTAPTTLVDSFAAIDAQYEQRAAGIEQTATNARLLVAQLNELRPLLPTTSTSGAVDTESNTNTLRSLTDYLAEESGAVSDVADETAKAERNSALWHKTLEQLVKTIPGLSDIIDLNTDEIDGGTGAVWRYIDAWEQAEKLGAFKAASQQKVTAYAAAEQGLAQMEFDAMVARRLADNARKALETKLAAAGYTWQDMLARDTRGAFSEEYKAYLDLAKAADDAETAFTAQTEAVEQCKQEMLAAADVVGEMTAEEDDLALSADRAKALLQAFADTTQRIADIHQATWDETAKSVDGVIKGFEKFITPAQKARQEMEKLDAAALKYNEDGTLSQKWTSAAENVPTMSSMMESMRSQIAYMQEYEGFLATLRANGVAEDILAQFADGSMENFDILSELAANPNQLADWIALYRQRETAKEGFTGTLTDYKLMANGEYQTLLDTEANLVDQLDMADPAQDASERTVQGIIDGIAMKLPELQSEVDAALSVLSQLASFNGYGYGSFFGGFNYSSSKWSSYGLVDGSHAGGLDYVPFDGYLAALHEGESILTAEEARVWRNMQYGRGSGLDYDALGGVMRDNMGGNVYLDGRTVGRVISAAQGESYRGLERSGWRG